jgi:hypothetical protein
MYPFGIIGVAPRYIPAGAVVELAGFRLSCTSTPTGVLFIGTQFSILYTSMYSPAEAATPRA